LISIAVWACSVDVINTAGGAGILEFLVEEEDVKIQGNLGGRLGLYIQSIPGKYQRL
jgi:hypothetical protein